MRQLCVLLIEEQANLRAANASACEALLPIKAALVAQLGDLAEQRYKQLGTVGYSADEAGMQQWRVSAHAQAAAGGNAEWESLLALTREAHALNQVNGRLLQQLLSLNQAALQQLARTTMTDIYGPAGESQAIAVRSPRAVG